MEVVRQKELRRESSRSHININAIVDFVINMHQINDGLLEHFLIEIKEENEKLPFNSMIYFARYIHRHVYVKQLK